MQPDHGANPCTPNTLIRNLPERVGEPSGGPARFFLPSFIDPQAIQQGPKTIDGPFGCLLGVF